MKYIYLLIFFLSAFSSNNALAFWNKVSEEQKYQCQQEASMQQNDFSAKQRYKSCVRAFKEINKLRKKELREKGYIEVCSDVVVSDEWEGLRWKKVCEKEY